MSDEQNTENTGNESRMSYQIADSGLKLTVKRGGDQLEINANDLALEVQEHLTMLGLVSHLQRSCARVPKERKLDAVAEAMQDMETRGMGVFERKPRGFQSKGPRKQDKIAALAALKNATPTAIEQALAQKTKEEQERVLSHPKVLEKCAEMSAAVEL